MSKGIDAAAELERILNEEILKAIDVKSALSENGWEEWKNSYTGNVVMAKTKTYHPQLEGVYGYRFEYDTETNEFTWNGGEFSGMKMVMKNINDIFNLVRIIDLYYYHGK